MLDDLITQQEPLERHEIIALEEWLAALKEDVACFGSTAEDTRRMTSIRNRISLERART